MFRAACVIVCVGFFGMPLAAEECGPSSLDPRHYAQVEDHAMLREFLAEDIAEAVSPNGVLSMWCYTKHFSEMGIMDKRRSYTSRSVIQLVFDEEVGTTYYFEILGGSEPPGDPNRQPISAWATISFVGGQLGFMEDDGSYLAFPELPKNVLVDPRDCQPSLFDSSEFPGVRSDAEFRELLQKVASDYLERGDVDWLCFSYDFMAVEPAIKRRLSANIDTRGILNFGVRDVSIAVLEGIAREVSFGRIRTGLSWEQDG